jgi:hypothetical protein
MIFDPVLAPGLHDSRGEASSSEHKQVPAIAHVVCIQSEVEACPFYPLFTLPLLLWCAV